MSEQDFGACYVPPQHSCEICGLSGLSDELIRDHTRTCHVEGNIQCPFCGYAGLVSAELLLHVNQAHLDYLTPENEICCFEDYQNPRLQSDYVVKTQTQEECGGFSKSINKQNRESSTGFSIAFDESQYTQSSYKSTICNKKIKKSNCTNCSSNFVNEFQHLEKEMHAVNRLKNNKNDDDKCNCSTNSIMVENQDCKTPTNELNGTSPSRSNLNLNLKLKTHSSVFEKIPISQCPLCPFASQISSVLEEHINRSHFDPLSPINGSSASKNYPGESEASLQCPICSKIFVFAPDLELHVNIEHRDILSPGISKISSFSTTHSESTCPFCNKHFTDVAKEVEMHIEEHFSKSPKNLEIDLDIEMKTRKLREKREFEMLRAQYGMDDQGNFREQSAAAMQRAVYAGEMSVADYYERQVGLRAAESHGIDDGTSCTKSVAPRVLSLSSSSPGILKSFICTSVDHYASNYGDKGWGCGYRNLQMLLSSLLQNTSFNEALYSAWGNHGPSRTAMPSISRLQKMVEAAWAQGFDVQGSEQLGCKLYNTRKWIGATEIVTVLSWLRINCQLIDFHRPTADDGRHPELFNWVLTYFGEPRIHTAPLYLQHQGHSRTIIGIEKKSNGLTLLVLDPSHGPRQVAALGTSQDSLRLIRRGTSAMRAPQYQIVAVRGLIETEEQYQASKILRSLRIPPDR